MDQIYYALDINMTILRLQWSVSAASVCVYANLMMIICGDMMSDLIWLLASGRILCGSWELTTLPREMNSFSEPVSSPSSTCNKLTSAWETHSCSQNTEHRTQAWSLRTEVLWERRLRLELRGGVNTSRSNGSMKPSSQSHTSWNLEDKRLQLGS